MSENAGLIVSKGQKVSVTTDPAATIPKLLEQLLRRTAPPPHKSEIQELILRAKRKEKLPPDSQKTAVWMLAAISYDLRHQLFCRDWLPQKKEDCAPHHAAEAGLLITVIDRYCKDALHLTWCLREWPELYTVACQTIVPLERDMHYASEWLNGEQARSFNRYVGFTLAIQTSLTRAMETFTDGLASLCGRLHAHYELTFSPGADKQIVDPPPQPLMQPWRCPICNGPMGGTSTRGRTMYRYCENPSCKELNGGKRPSLKRIKRARNL
jgi:hypothetical protein